MSTKLITTIEQRQSSPRVRSAPRYCCSKCRRPLPTPPPDTTGWTCPVDGGLPTAVASAASPRDWFEAEVSHAADAAIKRLFRDEYTPLYLYYRRGWLACCPELPEGEGWRLGTPERLPTSLTRDQLRHWIHVRSTHLECLPEE